MDQHVVYQIKYSDGHSRRDASRWMIDAIDGELPSIRALVARGLKNYYIVTNVRGSSQLDSGAIDTVQKHLDKVKTDLGLETATAWWRDGVDIRLNAAPTETRLAFLEVLPATAILTLGLMETSPSVQADRSIATALNVQAERNKEVRFKQVDLASTDLTSLFVDVPISAADPNSSAALLIQHSLIRRGQSPAQAATVASVGAAKLLLEQPWRGHAVIVGGPGQGKTTLLQYVTQAHRAAQLRRAEGAHDGILLPRIPLTVDLRDFAAWFSPKRRKSATKKKPVNLETYICDLVADLSGGQLYTLSDLASLLARRPVLLALDGLDEVADLDARDDVAKEIRDASTRMHSALDLAILVTTRPGASTAPDLLGSRFQTLTLQPLNSVLRQDYLHKWAAQAAIDEPTVRKLSEALTENEIKPHVRDLGSNPMQLTILLHLLHRKGYLPEQRTALYGDYVDIFFEREAPKDPVITANREVIKEVHGYLAYRLQCMAEESSHDGRLTVRELHSIIDPFLWSHTSKPDVVSKLFAAVTNRVICLVQRVSNTFEFEVQPLREYFAAWHLFETADPRSAKDSRDDRLEALAIRPYWSNVLRFFVGLQTRGEIRAMISNYKQIDSNNEIRFTSLTQSLIFTLFSDLAYQQQKPADRQEAIDYALAGGRIILAADGLASNRLNPLPDDAGRREVHTHCLRRLLLEPTKSERVALGHVLDFHDFDDAEWVWTDEALQIPPHEWLELIGSIAARTASSDTELLHLDHVLSRVDASSITFSVLGPLSDPSPESMANLNARWAMGQDGLLAHPEPSHPASVLDHSLSLDNAIYLTGMAAGAISSSSATGLSPTASVRRIHRGNELPVRTKRISDAIKQFEVDMRASKYLDIVKEIDQDLPGSPRVAQWLLAAPRSWAALLHGVAASRLNPASQALTELMAAAEDHVDDEAWWRTEIARADRTPGTGLLINVLFITACKPRVVASLLADFDVAVSRLRADELRVLYFTLERLHLGRPGRQLDIAIALRNQRSLGARCGLLLAVASHDSTRKEIARLVREDAADALRIGSRVAQAWIDLFSFGVNLNKLTIPQLFGTRESLRFANLPIPAAPTLTECREVLQSAEQWPSQVVMGADAMLLRNLAVLDALGTVAARDGWSAELRDVQLP